MAEFREEGASSGLLESSTAAAVPAGNIRDVSDELTQFAPFEASKTISLSYRGDPSKPPQVEINDASYLGQPKVLFRKLREGNPSRPGGGGPAGIRDPELRGSAGGGAAGKNRVRVQVVGSGWHEEREGGAGGRRGGGKVVDPESGRVTKSLVLNRIGTLGKDQVCIYLFVIIICSLQSWIKKLGGVSQNVASTMIATAILCCITVYLIKHCSVYYKCRPVVTVYF